MNSNLEKMLDQTPITEVLDYYLESDSMQGDRILDHLVRFYKEGAKAAILSDETVYHRWNCLGSIIENSKLLYELSDSE